MSPHISLYLPATSEAALPKLRGVARLLLLHAELHTRLKQSVQSGRPMPTLRELYGQVRGRGRVRVRVRLGLGLGLGLD